MGDFGVVVVNKGMVVMEGVVVMMRLPHRECDREEGVVDDS